MAKKVKLTRPELKRNRDALQRFERFLPMLKLKQQQLQLTMRDVQRLRREALAEADAARRKFEPYSAVMVDRAGIDVRKLAEPEQVLQDLVNVAGIRVPVFREVTFAKVDYSLFATPPWVDRALADLRDVNARLARAEVLQRQYDLLRRELTKIIQRVNLFEKIKIPEARENIRIIRIHLGDEMTAAVGRAKIAKGKLKEAEQTVYQIDESGPAGTEAATQ